jgi:hypothetical protein
MPAASSLDIALRELDAAGIRDVEQVRGGKHLQLRWRANRHGLRVYTLPLTPSDWRSSHNTRADIRRMLREDGALAVLERAEPAPPPTPKLDRIAALEQRVEALEEFVRTIQIEGGKHAQNKHA